MPRLQQETESEHGKVSLKMCAGIKVITYICTTRVRTQRTFHHEPTQHADLESNSPQFTLSPPVHAREGVDHGEQMN